MAWPLKPEAGEDPAEALAFAEAEAQSEALMRAHGPPEDWLYHVTAEDRAAALAALCGVEGTRDLHEHAITLIEDEFGVFVGGSSQGPMVYEVRAVAIEYLQFQALFGWHAWRLESLVTPQSVSVYDVLDRRDAAFAALGGPERKALLERAEFEVLTRARHREGDGEVEIAHRALQLLELATADPEPVCPHTLLTPTMESFHFSNLQTERPRPHLRISSGQREDFLLGYVVMDDEGPVLDFASSAVARVAESAVTHCFDPAGAGLVSPDGTALLLDSTSPLALFEALDAHLSEYETEVVT